jgi:hypothetical protein
MQKIILYTALTLLTGLRLFAEPLANAAELASFDTYSEACVKGQASTHKPSFGLYTKAAGANYQSQFQAIDKVAYCKCVFDKYEKTFGRENYVKMRDYRNPFSPPGMNAVQSGQAITAIRYSCFGAQIGRPNFSASDLTKP